MIELLIFGLTPEVKPSPLIQNVIETQTVQVEPPPQEPTLEEKIATNYYKCDETRQYIRADNANCLDKPQYRRSTQRSSRNSTNTSVTTKNTYQAGQCVWHVKNLKPSIPNGWGSAYNWVSSAINSGWTVSDTPIAGAVGASGNHVVYVLEVRESTVLISEMNYNWTPYATRVIEKSISSYRYIY